MASSFFHVSSCLPEKNLFASLCYWIYECGAVQGQHYCCVWNALLNDLRVWQDSRRAKLSRDIARRPVNAVRRKHLCNMRHSANWTSNRQTPGTSDMTQTGLSDKQLEMSIQSLCWHMNWRKLHNISVQFLLLSQLQISIALPVWNKRRVSQAERAGQGGSHHCFWGERKTIQNQTTHCIWPLPKRKPCRWTAFHFGSLVTLCCLQTDRVGSQYRWSVQTWFDAGPAEAAPVGLQHVQRETVDARRKIFSGTFQSHNLSWRSVPPQLAVPAESKNTVLSFLSRNIWKICWKNTEAKIWVTLNWIWKHGGSFGEWWKCQILFYSSLTFGIRQVHLVYLIYRFAQQVRSQYLS